MIRCLRPCVAPILSLSLLTACGSVALGPPTIAAHGPWVTVNADNSGSKVSLRLDQELFVRLRVDPTTGYSWVLVEPAADVLTAVEPETFERDGMSASSNAALGDEVWRFKARHAGSATLRFESRRPRELQSGASPQTVYQLTVQ